MIPEAYRPTPREREYRRLVRLTKRWQTTFEALAKRCERKRAIIAIARHLLCVMVARLKSGRRYQPGFV